MNALIAARAAIPPVRARRGDRPCRAQCARGRADERKPEVIETPLIAAIAKDGIELKAKARVTVRANIDRLVGGAESRP